MPYSKLDRDLVLVNASTDPVALVVDVNTLDDFAIAVTYGAGAGGDMKLQASLDNSNFSDIPSSVQAMDVAGGYHIWNVTDAHYKYIKIIVPDSASNTVRLQGERDRD